MTAVADVMTRGVRTLSPRDSVASADARDYRVDFSKIEQRLPRYSPSWTVRAGIEELYAAYTGANLSAADWNGDRYYRLRTINSLRSRGLIDDNLRYAA